jgi:hypothetical protein
VPVTFSHCFLFFLIFYSLFFIALDALPCPAPALPCPYPALPLPLLCPCLALFRIFLLLPRTGGRSYTGNGYLKQDRTYTWWEVENNLGKLDKRR